MNNNLSVGMKKKKVIYFIENVNMIYVSHNIGHVIELNLSYRSHITVASC